MSVTGMDILMLIHTLTDSDAPRYLGGFIHNIIMSAVSVVFMIILRLYLGKLNKKLDEQEAGKRSGLPGVTTAKGFRYLL